MNVKYIDAKTKEDAMKKTAVLAIVSLSFSVLFSSCVIKVVDKPDNYYDYDDDEYIKTRESYYNYYYSAGYQSALPAPTATATQAAVKISYIILKVVGNNYYFYEGDREIAVWVFNNDGSVRKTGRPVNGLVIRYYEGSGVPESEMYFKNNERWGESKKYYPDGRVREKVYFENGMRHGNYFIYHPNGKVMEEGRYEKGERSGVYKKYAEDGKLWERGSYTGGKQKIEYARPTAKNTPVPTATPKPYNRRGEYREGRGEDDRRVDFDRQGRDWDDREGRYGREGDNMDRPVTVITVVATQAVRKGNEPAVITVVVTATPVPAVVTPASAEATGNPGERWKKEGRGKPGWVEEKKGVIEETQDARKELKEGMGGLSKEQKEEIKDLSGEVKEKSREAVNGIKEKTGKGPSVRIKKAEKEKADADGNTLISGETEAKEKNIPVKKERPHGIRETK